MARPDASTLSVKTAPALEPVTAAEAKLWARITTSSDDAIITSLITAARMLCENITKKAFITTSLYLWLDEFPSDGIIEIPRPPLQSVTSVKYQDTSNVQQTLSASYYGVITASEYGKIQRAYNVSWPATLSYPGSVLIEYKAGYGDAASTVPEIIKTAIKVLVAHWYDSREPVLEGQMVKVPFHVMMMLNSHKSPLVVMA